MFGGEPPLLAAVIEGHCEVVDTLLEAEEDVNMSDDEYFTPLMQAVSTDQRIGTDQRLLRALLDAAADVNRADVAGHTALLGAATNDNREVIKLLVEARADINMSNDDNETPLFYAVYHGSCRMVSYFIDRGARVNQRTPGGSQLHLAAEKGRVDEVPMLLTGRADLQQERLLIMQCVATILSMQRKFWKA